MPPLCSLSTADDVVTHQVHAPSANSMEWSGLGALRDLNPAGMTMKKEEGDAAEDNDELGSHGEARNDLSDEE